MRCANFRWVSLATTVTVGVTNVWCNLQRRGVFFSAVSTQHKDKKSGWNIIIESLSLLYLHCKCFAEFRWIVNQKSDKTFGFDRVEWPKPSPRR